MSETRQMIHAQTNTSTKECTTGNFQTLQTTEQAVFSKNVHLYSSSLSALVLLIGFTELIFPVSHMIIP